MDLTTEIFFSLPLFHNTEPQPFSGMRLELHAEDIPQVLLPEGLLVPEDPQGDTLGREPQHADGFIVSSLAQVNAVDLGNIER